MISNGAASRARSNEQAKAVAAVRSELKRRRRAQYQMTMGAGKTYVALEVARDFNRVVVLVPTRLLVEQFIADYVRTSASGHAIAALDGRQIADSSDVVSFFRANRRAIVVATYAGQHKVIAASRSTPIDLIVADEAHRTAGREDKAWGAFLDEIDARRFLFQTGTVKTFAARLRKNPIRDQLDRGVYGRCVYKLPMSAAIDAGIVQDYRVSVLVDSEQAMSEAERRLPALARTRLADRHRKRQPTDFEIALIGGTLRECVRKGYRKLLAFAASIADVQFYVDLIPMIAAILHERNRRIPALRRKAHVLGLWQEHGDHDRNAIIKQFATHPTLSILVSCRTLTEGVSIPAVDSALLLSPRRSRFDLAQIVGRTQRLHREKQKPSMIVLPAIVRSVEDFRRREEFTELREVLQRLAYYDDSWKLELDALSSFRSDARKPTLSLTPRLEFSTNPDRVDILSRLCASVVISTDDARRQRFRDKHDRYVALVRAGATIPTELVSFRQDVVAQKISSDGHDLDPLFSANRLVLRTVASARRVIDAYQRHGKFTKEVYPAFRGHRQSFARGTLAKEVVDLYKQVGLSAKLTTYRFVSRNERERVRATVRKENERARNSGIAERQRAASDARMKKIEALVQEVREDRPSFAARKTLAHDRVHFRKGTLPGVRARAYEEAGGLDILQRPRQKGRWIKDAAFEKRVQELAEWIRRYGAPPTFDTTGVPAFFAALRNGTIIRTPFRQQVLVRENVLRFADMSRRELLAVQRKRRATSQSSEPISLARSRSFGGQGRR